MSANPKPFANAAAQAGSCPTKGCKTCERIGLPILPLRYAVIPRNLDRNVQLRAGLGEGVTNHAIEQHGYGTRVLRKGYLYVYLEGKGIWQAYGVSAEGHLTQFPIPWDAPGDATESLDETCTREGHNIPASFINIREPEIVKKAWLAFSQSQWSKEVLQRYQGDRNLRKLRMVELDLTQPTVEGQQHAFDLDEQTTTLQSQTEEYATAMRAGRLREGWTAHEYADRVEEIEQLQKYTAAYLKTAERLPAVAVLPDPAGIVAELNYQRAREQFLHQQWAEGTGSRGTRDPERPWKKLSSDAIVGVRESILTECVNAGIAELWGSTPGAQAEAAALPHDPNRTAEQARAEIREVLVDKPKTITPDPVITPGGIPHYPRPYTTTANKLGSARANRQLSTIEDHYAEPQRKSFADNYEAMVKRHQCTYEALDKDYAAWLEALPGEKAAPTVDTLCAYDYLDAKPTEHCIVGYVRLVSDSVAGGPALHSRTWFEARMQLPVEKQAAIMQRALVGNDKALFPWLNENQRTSVYDEIRALAEGTSELAKAGHLPGYRWIAPVVAAYANPIVAAMGATTFALRANFQIRTPMQEALEHTVAVALALWSRLEVAYVQVRLTLGELQSAMMQTSFAGMLAGNMPVKQARNVARAGVRYQLPPHLADRLVTARLATFAQPYGSPGTAAQQQAANLVQEASNNLHNRWRRAMRILPPGQAREFVRSSLMDVHRTLSAKQGLLGAAGLVIQTSALLDNIDKVRDVAGEDQTDAMLGIGVSAFGLIAAGTEVVGAAGKRAFGKKFFDVALRRAAGFNAIGTAFMAVQSGLSATRAFKSGDRDAFGFHTAAVLAFTGSIAASAAIFLGAKATFFGAMLGLGPVGWGFLLLGAGLILTYMAFAAEDGEAEKWIARNKWWSISDRTDPRFRSWQDEAEALNILAYGLKVSFGWSDTVGGSLGFGMDELKLRATIPRWINGHAYRYRLIASMKHPAGQRPIPVEIYNKASGMRQFNSIYKPQPAVIRAVDPNAPKGPVAGEDFQIEDAKITFAKKSLTISHDFGLSDDQWVLGWLEFEFWPDPEDESTKARVVVAATDD